MSPTTPSLEFLPINTSVALLNTFGCPCRQYPNHTPSPSVPSAPAFDDTLEAPKESILLWILGIWFLASVIGVKLAEAYDIRPQRPNYGLLALAILAAAGAIQMVGAEAITAPVPTVTNLGPERQALSAYPLPPIPTVEGCGFRSAAPSSGLSLRSIALAGVLITLIVASMATARYVARTQHELSNSDSEITLPQAWSLSQSEDEKFRHTVEDATQPLLAPRQPKRQIAGATRMAILLVSLIVMAFLVPIVLASPTGTFAMTATASAALITNPAVLDGSNGTWWMMKDKPQSCFVNACSTQSVLSLLSLVALTGVIVFLGDQMTSAGRRARIGKTMFLLIAVVAVAALLPSAAALELGGLWPASNISLVNGTGGDPLTWVPTAVSGASSLSFAWPTIALSLVSILVVWATLTGHGIFAAMTLTLVSLLPLALAQANGPVTTYVAPGPGSQSGGGIPNTHHKAGLPRAELSWLAVVVAILCLVTTAQASISLPGILESEGMTATANEATPSRTAGVQVTVTPTTSAAQRNESPVRFFNRSRRSIGSNRKSLLSLVVLCLLAFLVPSALAQCTSETSGVTSMVGPPIQHTRLTEGPITARAAPLTPPPAYAAAYVDASNATATVTISREVLGGINFRLRSQGQRTATTPFRIDWASMTTALWGFAAGVALFMGMLV
ncbi:hypothetical protein LTR95_014572 [Oleoguttula sp. CCFEE 5521]